jgi:protein-tyrosine phosphatase
MCILYDIHNPPIYMYKLAPASAIEPIVFGAARPGYRIEEIERWIKFMQTVKIEYVCCLLAPSQLKSYPNLLEIYQQEFGIDRVCWAPIEDFQLADREVLTQQILPFLSIANQNNARVVVHCSGGIGRTGHVLAAWLVAGRGLSNHTAIAAVKKMGKNPYESAIFAPLMGRNPWQVITNLNILLNECRSVSTANPNND